MFIPYNCIKLPYNFAQKYKLSLYAQLKTGERYKGYD
jgi:hypothetical protein